MDDWQLLNEYALKGSEEAFRQLVDRYAGMVYHAALRQLGNRCAAEEVAQGVFIALAQKAGGISRQTLICGWLFRATRYAVLNRVREEACRRHYEQQAMESFSQETESVWLQIAPHLDGALERLSRSDREVVMLRFFGNKSHRELAEQLGITEGTAKKRLSRALEKLRGIFARRGLTVSTAVLGLVLGTYGAQGAPAGLASAITAAALAPGSTGVAASGSLAQSILKLMAWAKAKTALAVGAGVLVAAAGTATVALRAASAPAEDLRAKLEHQSGQRIVWDKHLVVPAGLELGKLPLEQALDKVAVAASAYWTIDYVLYDSDEALRNLVNLLREGSALAPGGWTNLSSRALEPRVEVMPYDPHGHLRIALRFPKESPANRVGMIVVLGPTADPQLFEGAGPGRPAPMRLGEPVPESPAFKLISEAMQAGSTEGVLAPERLLAERRLVPSLHAQTPIAASAEAAARLARAAHARWTTIYTLRPSPIPGAGIKLVHAGMESMYGPSELPASPESFAGGPPANRFKLSPEDREAHQRAVEAWKKQPSR